MFFELIKKILSLNLIINYDNHYETNLLLYFEHIND